MVVESGIIRMVMKLKLYSLLCVSLLFLFAACNQDDAPVPPEVGSRTVLVYMAADNDLAFFAEEDVDEMIEGMKLVDSPSCNLLVYQDGVKTPVLFRIAKDKKGNVRKEIIKEYAEQVSTDASVMKEVLHRAFYEYPAESYGLVYWSHADGWIPYPVPSASTRWIGQDQGDGRDHRMNISDFVDVLEDGMPHFDFIMFDACFMMSIEVAYAVRNYTEYYVGCPTEIPGPGAPYDKVVPWMFQQGAANRMAEAYFNYYNENYRAGSGMSNTNWTGGVSVCVVKADALGDLAAVTKQVISEAAGAENTLPRDEVFDYDARRLSFDARDKKSHVGYYDFPQMMEVLLADDEAYTAWKQAYDASIVYWNTTEKNYSRFVSSYGGMFSMEGANGVTHYIPLSLDSQAAGVYHLTAWYKAAGLAGIGW